MGPTRRDRCPKVIRGRFNFAQENGKDLEPVPLKEGNQKKDRELSAQLIEERLGFLQVLRVEAFGEPAIDGREEFAGFPDPTLVAHEPCIARRRAQLTRDEASASKAIGSRAGASGRLDPLVRSFLKLRSQTVLG